MGKISTWLLGVVQLCITLLPLNQDSSSTQHEFYSHTYKGVKLNVSKFDDVTDKFAQLLDALARAE